MCSASPGKGSFSEELKEAATGIWDRIYSQPFLLEMREGTLPLDKFRFYIGQDYVYLVDFARCLGLAAAKAEDMETMRALAELLKSSTTVEIEMLEELNLVLPVLTLPLISVLFPLRSLNEYISGSSRPLRRLRTPGLS